MRDFIAKMLLGIILSFVASGVIGTVWYSKSVFGSAWLRHCFGDAHKCPACPQGWDENNGAMLFTAVGNAATMILLASLFSAEMAAASTILAAVNGLKLGLLVALSQISHAVFSRTSATVYLIQAGYDVTIICVAAVIMHFV